MEEDPNPQQSLRFNEGKLPMHYWMLYPKCAKMIAWVQARGEEKYGYGNWAIGGKDNREYMDSGFRHFYDWLENPKEEVFDDDTGSHPLGQFLWNMMNLIERNVEGSLWDPDFDIDAFREKWKDHPKNDVDPRDYM